MNIDFRSRARAHLAEAQTRLSTPGEASARQACLSLRMAIEALTYQVLQAYLSETPNSVMAQWTPKKVLDELLAVDPHADRTAKIFVGREDVPGEPAKVMEFLGEDRRFTVRWGNKAHNALGNFLHEPTLRQHELGKATLEADARAKAAEILAELERILSAPLFNVNFGEFITFDCTCGFLIKRKANFLSPEKPVVCGACGRRYIYQDAGGDDQHRFIPDRATFNCFKCDAVCSVEAHELSSGKVVTCACGAEAEVYSELKVRPVAEAPS
ncbi:hypothetical protein [Falsiroseomonas sp.]|uniref:hypothetical protein n=1 Tax=Falsiroseomonas sp. TaxID=2870721 RepID=UPI0027210A08|nr:hypothetical protein [Falsiroseomonas sp.]MDO9499114.1 hypothetical protein [Falsiroseomonas sp.]